MSRGGASASASQARGHEQRDVSLRPVVFASIGLAVLILVAVVSMRLLFDFLLARAIRHSSPANPLALAEGKPLPPEPRLLPQPIEQLRALRAEEDAVLGSYGWVDRKQGIVRVPIEQAMKLVVERGVRATGGGSPAAEPDEAPAAGRMQAR